MTDLVTAVTTENVEQFATVGPWALLTGDKGPTGPQLPTHVDRIGGSSTDYTVYTQQQMVRRICGAAGVTGVDYAGFQFGNGWQHYGGGHLLVQCYRDAQGRCILQGLAYCTSTSAASLIFSVPWDMIPCVGGYARMVHQTNTTGVATRWDTFSPGAGGNADAAEMNWNNGGSFTNGYWVQFDSIYQTFMPMSWVDYGCQHTATSTVSGQVDYVVSPGRVSTLNAGGGKPLTMDIPRTTIRLPYVILAGGSYSYYFWFDIPTQQFGHTLYTTYNKPLGHIDPTLNIVYDPYVWLQMANNGRVPLALWTAVYGTGLFMQTYNDRRFFIRGPLD